MKKSFSVALFSAILLIMSTCCSVRKPVTVMLPAVVHTPERSATHMIIYVEEDAENGGLKPRGECTGTAVGPHALLTAVHCDYGKIRAITLDYSVNPYHILAGIKDKTDHVVYILDGPAFTNYIHVKARNPVMDEPVISYGAGQRDWPPHQYVGRVIVDDNGGDDSDVDKREGATCFSIPVVPGDSGSAIYGVDGSIVALATYQNEHNTDKSLFAVGFPLTFAPEDYEQFVQLTETENN